MPLTIQDIRQQYPQYSDMSDAQLADSLHQTYYSDIPKTDFYNQIGLKQGFQKSFEGSLEGGVASAVGGLADLAQNKYVQDLYKISPVGKLANFLMPQAQQQSEINQAAQDIRAHIQPLQAESQEHLAGNPNQIASLAGGVLPYLAGATIDPMLPIAMMGSQGANEQAERARAMGKAPSDAGVALGAASNAALGAVPLGKYGEGLVSGIESQFGRRAANAGLHALAGGAAGGAMQFGNNLVTQQTLDPNQSLTEGVPQSAASMALLGGVMGGLNVPAMAKRAIDEAGVTPSPPPPESPIQPKWPGIGGMPPQPDLAVPEGLPEAPIAPLSAPARPIHDDAAPELKAQFPTMPEGIQDIITGHDEEPIAPINSNPQPAPADGGNTGAGEQPIKVASTEDGLPSSIQAASGPQVLSAQPDNMASPAAIQAASDDLALFKNGPRPGKTLMSAIKELGGLKLKDPVTGESTAGPDVNAIMPEGKKFPPGMVNNQTGMAPESMEQALHDRGWFGVTGDDTPPHDALVNALQQDIVGAGGNGDRYMHPEDPAAMDQNRIQNIQSDLNQFGIDPRHPDAPRQLAEAREAMANEPPPASPEDYGAVHPDIAESLAQPESIPPDEMSAAAFMQKPESEIPGEADEQTKRLIPANDEPLTSEWQNFSDHIANGNVGPAFDSLRPEYHLDALDSLVEHIDEFGRKNGIGQSGPLTRLAGRVDDLADAMEKNPAAYKFTSIGLERALRGFGRDYPGVLQEITRSVAADAPRTPIEVPVGPDAAKTKIVTDKLKANLSQIGLGDVGVRLVNHIQGAMDGYAAHGSYDPNSTEGKIISLARDVYEPNITEKQLSDRLQGVMNHEIIHAVYDLGILKPEEKVALEKAAARQKAPGDSLTHLERAQADNPNLSPEKQKEEAVAEMYRHWADRGQRVMDQPSGLLNRIYNALRNMVRAVGRSGADKIMSGIQSGDIGARERTGNQPTADGQSPSLMAKAITPSTPNEKAEEIIRNYGIVGAKASAWADSVHMSPELKGKLSNLFTKATVFGVDQKVGLARFALSRLEAGDKGIIQDNPRLANTRMTGRVQKAILALHDGLISKTKDMVTAIKANKTMVNDLEAGSPKDGYISKLRADNPNMRPSQILVNAELYSAHAPERNQFIRDVRQRTTIDPVTGKEIPVENGSGMSNAEAKYIQDYISKLPVDVRTQIKAAADQVRGIYKFIQTTRETAGLSPRWDDIKAGLKAEVARLNGVIADPAKMASEKADATKQLARTQKALSQIPDYQNYVPLRGKLGEADDDSMFSENNDSLGVGGISIKGREDPYALGRQSYANDIIATTHDMAIRAVRRAEEVKIGQSILRAVQRAGGDIKDYATLLPTDPTTGRQAVPKVMSKDSNSGKAVYRVDPSYREPKSPYFSTKVDGNEVWMELKNDALRAALKGTGGLGLPAWIEKPLNVMQMGTHFIAEAATTYNPVFSAMLIARHTMAAMFNGLALEPDITGAIAGNTAKYFTGLGKGGDAKVKADIQYLKDNGALTGIFSGRSTDEMVKDLQKEYDRVNWNEANPVQKAAQVAGYAGKVLEGFRALNNHAEWATRYGVFKTLVDKGYDPKYAAAQAKELTIDFDQRGAATSDLGKLYAFVNASIQGSASSAKAIASSGRVRAAVAGLMLQGATQQLVGQMMGGQDDQGNNYYDLLPASVKEKNMVFMIPGGKGAYVKVPMPYEFAAFQRAGRLVSDGLQGKTSVPGAIGNTLMSFINNYDPAGDTKSGLNTLIPTAARPFFDIKANKAWNGRPIHPEDSGFGGGEVDSAKHFSYASGPSQIIASALHSLTGGVGDYVPGSVEIHPDDLDYLYNSITGGVGKLAGQAFSLPGKIAAGNVGVQDIPLASQFAGQINASSDAQKWQQYVQVAKPIEQEYNKALKMSNNPDTQAQGQDYYATIMARYPTQLSAYTNVIQKVEMERADYRKQIKSIQADSSQTPAQQAQNINQVKALEDADIRQGLAQLQKPENRVKIGEN